MVTGGSAGACGRGGSAGASGRDPGQDHRDVVFAAPGERRDQGVADGFQGPVLAGQDRPHGQDALVERAGPAFHQPIGVQREDGARRELDAGLAAASGSRIVYVDNDEVAVAHSRLMLEDNPDATVIQADLREPDKILADPETQLLLDFTQPVALLLLAVLHFVPDA